MRANQSLSHRPEVRPTRREPLKHKPALVSVVQPDADETALREAIIAKLTYVIGKQIDAATPHDWYCATALAVRDRIVDIWSATRRETKRLQKKRVYYLSIEFLIGLPPEKWSSLMYGLWPDGGLKNAKEETHG